MSSKERQIAYAALIFKAKKALDIVRHETEVKMKDFMRQKFYYHKAIDLYKKALMHASTDMERARVHLYMGDGFIQLGGVQFESEVRAKYLARAFKQYALSVQLAPPHHFDKEIARESDRIHKFLLFKINDRTDDLEVIQ